MKNPVYVYKSDDIARYGFGDPHPFGTDRHDVFHEELAAANIDGLQFAHGRRANVDELALFHTAEYIERVSRMSAEGRGFLDDGDTPAVKRHLRRGVRRRRRRAFRRGPHYAR